MSERIFRDVKVGRDVIKDAEFFNYKDFANSMPKLEETKWEKLYYIITAPFRRLRRWFRELINNICFAFQRMFKDYDSQDIWNIDAGFVDRYTKILTVFRKKRDGYPVDLTEDEWTGVIDDMLYHLHYMSEYNIDEELEKQVPEDWTAASTTIRDIQEKHKDEFFALFSKYFYNLWY